VKAFSPATGVRILIGVLALWLPVLFAFPAGAYDRRSPVVEAVEKSGPAVVNIRTEQIVRGRNSPFFGFSDPFFDQFFQDLVPPRTYRTQSLGSGVIIDPKGYVLTNAHVIEKASKIFVALTDRGQELEAELVGLDEGIDLAVLRIQGEGPFPALQPGRSDDLLVGETVIAIGNPLGLGHSITTGIVSSTRRRLPIEGDGFALFIQTDALINPGNSGGPLININGELIGINTAIIQQAQGIGFAIPIETARRIIDDLIKLGRVRRAFLGIIPGEVGQAFSTIRGAGGVLVNRIEPGSPAQRAGILVADVLLALDGDPVGSPAEYRSLLRTYTPDSRIRINLLRGMEPKEVEVELSALPAGYALDYATRVFGLDLIESRHGLLVKQVISGSTAEQTGIRPGDRVAEVAGEQVTTSEEFSRAIEERIGLEPLRFLVVRNGRGYYLDLP